MSPTSSSIELQEWSTRRACAAVLVDAVTAAHLDDVERYWAPYPGRARREQGHWDWHAKIAWIQGSPSSKSFAVECEGRTQGLMIVDAGRRSRLPASADQGVVYVDYLESAPWNRADASDARRFRGVGVVLLAAAIQTSLDCGFQGRIGLHSLPQSEVFYRERIAMTDCGPDDSYYALRYFEYTDAQAASFMRAEGGE